MGLINFLGRWTRKEKILELVAAAKGASEGAAVDGWWYFSSGSLLILEGSLRVLGPIILASACMGLVQDMNDARKQLASNKDFHVKIKAAIRPFVYISLNLASLRLATRTTALTSDLETSNLYDIINYAPTVVRNAHRKAHHKSLKISEAKALRQNLFILNQKSFAFQGDLFYALRIFRSCLIIENEYAKKSFDLEKQNAKISSEKQIESPLVYLETVEKQIGTVGKLKIQNSEFSQVLLKQTKVDEKIYQKRKNPYKIILEQIRKDAEELKKTQQKD